jgi:hypothetical protein
MSAVVNRAAGGLFAILFTWSAWLQLNDPDPARWVAMYMSAALVALRAPRFPHRYG